MAKNIHDIKTLAEHAQIIKNNRVVVIDYWAPWCGPCRAFTPTFEKVAEHLDGQAVFCKVNIDEATELASAQHVASIPTLHLYKDHQLAEQKVGALAESALMQWVQQACQSC